MENTTDEEDIIDRLNREGIERAIRKACETSLPELRKKTHISDLSVDDIIRTTGVEELKRKYREGWECYKEFIEAIPYFYFVACSKQPSPSCEF